MRLFTWCGRTLLLAAALAVFSVCVSGCGGKGDKGAGQDASGTLVDSRDGQRYRTVKIGELVWMAANLNYNRADDSYCYDDKERNCAEYGRLYDGFAAKEVCPAGWHLPVVAEWEYLEATVGYKVAGIKLKTHEGWRNGGGNDYYGFSAQAGGRQNEDGTFSDIDASGYWWTADEGEPEGVRSYTFYREISSETDEISGGIEMDANRFSVRCVQDADASGAAKKYSVTISSAGDGAAGGGSYAPGAVVTLTAGTPPAGQRFKKWTTTSGGVYFANADRDGFKFVMPSNDVAVTANFDANTVTVSSEGAGAAGGGAYAIGAAVTVTAGTPPAGKYFKYWTVSDGVTFSAFPNAQRHSATAKFTMPDGDVTVTAVFEKKSDCRDADAFAGRDGLETFTDTRDGKKYRIVTIGGKTWTAENMNYKADGSWCDDNCDCKKYGRTYDLGAAHNACPAGWHLSSGRDWYDLTTAVGDKPGKKLKAKPPAYDGTDDYGFSALPGAGWWTGSSSGSGRASGYYRMAAGDDNATEDYANQVEEDDDAGFSVRCVQGERGDDE